MRERPAPISIGIAIEASRGCRLPPVRDWVVRPLPMPYVEVAQRFGDLIAKEDYSTAHTLLTREAQRVHSPDDFRAAVIGMTTYAPGPIQRVIVMEDFILEEWPKKQNGDVAIVYTSLEGDGFCEAVTVTIVKDGGDFRIRHLEWGRP